jgi:hypothetical protein
LLAEHRKILNIQKAAANHGGFFIAQNAKKPPKVTFRGVWQLKLDSFGKHLFNRRGAEKRSSFQSVFLCVSAPLRLIF